MSTNAAGGGKDGNGGGDPKRKKTNTTPDPKKMSMLERGVIRYMQGKTANAIARGEELPWNGLYAPIDMHHYLQRKLQMPLQEERNLIMVIFMLRVAFSILQQTRVLLIHQLKKLPRKINLCRQIARMAKYWNFV
jgi:hypothetical protein